jgi:hypothetical protein
VDKDVGSTETLISASITSDGGFILLGSKGDSVLLIKLDSLGNLVWGKVYEHTFPLHPASVIQTTDGGYAILGKKVSITPSIFVIKTNSAGDISWAKEISVVGTTSLDLASIIQTLDGNYTLVGSSSTSGVIMVKLNTSGDTMWSRFFNNTLYNEFPTDLLQTTDGNYVVAGYLVPTIVSPAPFLLKTDTGGNRIWWKIYTAGPNRKIFSLDTFSNGFVMAGVSGGSGLIMRVDNNGNPSWAKTYSSSDRVRFNSIRRTSGGFVLTGRIGDNVLLVKTDTSGNVIWAKKFSGFSTSAEGISLRVLGDGIFIGGNSDNDLLTIKTNNSGMVSSCDSFVTDVSLNTTSLSLLVSTVAYASVPLTLSLPTPLSLSVSTSSINTSTVCLDATRPRIVLTHPDSGSIYVPLSANIGVWFSKPIIDTTINASSVSITGWDGSSFRTYSFNRTCPTPNFCVLDPILKFRPNEEITVRFDSTIRDNL